MENISITHPSFLSHLWEYRHKLYVLLLLFFLHTSTKPQAWKLRESIMAATVAHSAIIIIIIIIF